MTVSAASSNRIPNTIWVVVLVLSVLYALAWFSGLEYHRVYRGQTYKTLHPESFPSDPYLATGGPVRLSSYYVLVRLVGDLWLDDRLTLGVYVGLVVLALIGMDRTAHVLGARGLAERLAVIGLMAIPHGFRDNMAMIVTFADFYAGTFAGVAAIWLIYVALAGARLRWVIGALALVWSLTMKWAWFPTVIALTCIAQQRLSVRQRRWALAGSLLGLGVFYLAYMVWLRPAGDLHTKLFDYLTELEGSEANPWLDSVMGNLKYWGLLGFSLLLPVPVPAMARLMRLVAFLGALLWVLGGAYLTLSADILKVPYLVPLAFNRAMQWPQYVLYLSITVGALARMRASSWGVRLGLGGLLLVLYATFDLRRMLLAGLAWPAVFGLCIVAHRWWQARRQGAARQRSGRALAVPAGLAVALTTMLVCARVIVRRAPALAFLARHGVIGDNPSAKWVGVDTYFREQTPTWATVLAIAPYDYPWRPGLCYDGSLRVRTGRTMPLGGEWSVLFDYPRLLQIREERGHMKTLIQAWSARDIDTVQQELRYFNALGYALDYLVMEPQEAAWFQEHDLPYRLETTIGRFTVLKRHTAAGAGTPNKRS